MKIRNVSKRVFNTAFGKLEVGKCYSIAKKDEAIAKKLLTAYSKDLVEEKAEKVTAVSAEKTEA